MNFLAPAGMGAISDICGTNTEDRKTMSVRGTQFSVLANFIACLLVVNIINWLTPYVGQSNSYTVVATVFAVPFIFCSGMLRKSLLPYEAEKKKAIKTAPKVSLGDMVRSVGSNSQLLVFVVSQSICTIGTTVLATVTAYYFIYVSNNYAMMSFVTAGAVLVGLIGTLIAPKVAKVLGKKWICVLGMALISVGLIIIYFSSSSMIIFIVGYAFNYFGRYIYFGYRINLVQDSGEYGYWKSGKDNRAVEFGMSNLPAKIGFIAGGALGTYGLAYTGYEAGMTVTAAWTSSFMTLIGLVPAAIVALSVIIFAVGYKITDSDSAKYAKENAERIVKSANVTPETA